jgi:hypothetical protein
MASKHNKRKYADSVEEEAEEVPLKKERTISDDTLHVYALHNFDASLEFGSNISLCNKAVIK